MTRPSGLAILALALGALGSGCNGPGTPGNPDDGGFWGDWLDQNVNGEGEELGPAPDSDGDGLSDTRELKLGTDPNNPDTDGDDWTDFEEVEGNTDPTKKNDHPYEGGWPIDACRHDIVATGDQVGDITADFELLDQFGEMVSLHDFCGKEILLVGAGFW